MALNEFANFLGWCTLINIGILLFATNMLVVAGSYAAGLHGRMFKLDQAEVRKSYFNYLANYKLLILVFNLVPYLAIRVLAIRVLAN